MAGTTAPHGSQIAMGPLREEVLEVGDEAADGPMAVGPAHQLGEVFRGGVKAVFHGTGSTAPCHLDSQLKTRFKPQGPATHSAVLPSSCLLLACK